MTPKLSDRIERLENRERFWSAVFWFLLGSICGILAAFIFAG